MAAVTGLQIRSKVGMELTDVASKRTILVVSAVASFLSPFMISSVNISLPSIGREFDASATLLGWVATTYLLATAASLVPMGKFADIVGRKKIFALGAVLFAASNFSAAASPSLLSLIFFRVIQGIGGAMIVTTSVAILASVFPPGERGRAMGINTASIYLGMSMGPFFGGTLVQRLGWRSVFLAGGLASVCVFYLVKRHLRGEWADAKGEKFDAKGSLLYVASLIFFMYGVSLLPANLGIYFMMAGGALLVAFVKRELSIYNPVFEVRLFVINRTFAFSNLAALINYSATAAVAFLLSLYLQYAKGLSPQNAGLILMVQPAFQALLSPSAGRLSDRIEPGIIASLGMALTAIGLFMLSMLELHTSLYFVALSLSCLGVGFALFSSPNTNAIMSSVSREYYGIASGSLATMRLLGQMTSLALATVLFAFTMGQAQIGSANLHIFVKSVNVAFAISAILCAIGIYFSYARGKLHNI